MWRKIIETLLTGDRFASWVRHGLTFLAGILVARGFLNVDQAATLVDALVNIFASPELLSGLVAFAIGKSASTANKVL